MSLKYHPDKNPPDKKDDSEADFKALGQAYNRIQEIYPDAFAGGKKNKKTKKNTINKKNTMNKKSKKQRKTKKSNISKKVKNNNKQTRKNRRKTIRRR